MAKTDEQAGKSGARSGIAGMGVTTNSAHKSVMKSAGRTGAKVMRKTCNKREFPRKADKQNVAQRSAFKTTARSVRKGAALLAAALLSLFSLSLSACAAGTGARQTESKDYLRGVVVVDAGHGGVDGGVVGKKTGVKESELNLAVAKKLRDLLRSSGFTVVMTRESSAGLYGFPGKGFKRRDMEKRRDVILNAGADVVISVHMNYFSDGRRRGGQTFYLGGSKEGRALASFLQEEFNALGERDYNPLAGDYYMLECTSVPSCIAECGFLSNAEDEALLLTESYQSAVAYAIFKGIAAYLSAKIE